MSGHKEGTGYVDRVNAVRRRLDDLLLAVNEHRTEAALRHMQAIKHDLRIVESWLDARLAAARPGAPHVA